MTSKPDCTVFSPSSPTPTTAPSAANLRWWQPTRSWPRCCGNRRPQQVLSQTDRPSGVLSGGCSITPTKLAAWLRRTFLIDPQDSAEASYSFVYTTDSLLLRVLYAADDPEVTGSTLARDALMSVKDKLNPDGAAFGYRKTPWATARAIAALVPVAPVRSTFPTRDPEYVDSKRTGPYLFALMVLVLVALVALALVEQLNPWSGVLLALFVLAILLAYGKIGEKTFAEAFGALMGTWSKKSNNS